MDTANITNLDQLLNQPVDFYGVDFNKFCVGIDNTLFIFEAVEDENDGYRSMMQDVYLLHVNYKGEIKSEFGIYFKSPIAKCIINKSDVFDGYELVDVENKHVWLEFGTDNSDHWYPTFVFYYQPREDQLIKPETNHTGYPMSLSVYTYDYELVSKSYCYNDKQKLELTSKLEEVYPNHDILIESVK